MTPEMEKRIHFCDLLFRLYQNNNAFADLLCAAGNTERAESVREDGRKYARAKVSDWILNGGRKP
jgi:hypothetical protein